MTRILPLFLLTLCAWPQSLVLKNFSIIDPVRGTVREDQSVVIRGDRIVEVGAAKDIKTPRGAEVLENRSRGRNFLLPGLIDGHVHLSHYASSAHLTPEEMLPLYLAWGVTSLRTAGDPMVAAKMAEKFAAANDDKCPRVFLSSPMLERDTPIHRDAGWTVHGLEYVPELIADMKKWGVRTIKLYTSIDRVAGQRIIEEAHQQGMAVSGHLGAYPVEDAIADGIDVVEHVWGIANSNVPPAKLAELLVRHKTAVTPNLAGMRNSLLLADMLEVHGHSDVTLVPDSLRVRWAAYRMQLGLSPATLEERRKRMAGYQELVGTLHRAGVPLIAGSDAPNPYLIPGASLHTELQLLTASGLTPAEALRTATIHPARALKMESSLGTIEPGKFADLLILSANPLDDIRNTRKISVVIRGGLMAQPLKLLKSVLEP